MRCPRCNRVVPDNSAACAACGEDLQLDPLGSELEMLWDDTPSTPAPSREVFTSAQSTAEIAAAPQPPPAPGRQTFGEGLQATISTHIVDVDPEKDRHTRIVEVSVPAVVRRAVSTSVASLSPDRAGKKAGAADDALDRSIEDLGDSLRLFYARMHRIDRLSFWATLLTFVAAFLPWSNVLGQGLVSGVEGLGGISAGCAALAGLCIYARTARRRLGGLVLLAQLVVASGVVAVPVYQFFYQPGLEFQVGLYATAVLGACVIVLTFMRLAVRSA